MPSGPQGVRISLTIPLGLESQIARSAVVRAGLHRLVDEIATRADETCPVGADEHLPPGHEPGHLKASQRHEVIETPRGLVGVIAYMAFYAHMVHNGTAHAHPNPWLLNAALGVSRMSAPSTRAA